MKKTHSVVMLPTEKASNLFLNTNTISYLQQIWEKSKANGTNQHLYIISDEQPKDGEWYMNKFGRLSVKVIGDKSNEGDKKIVATTDKLASGKCMKERCLLHPCDGKCCVPQIPESFIQAYIKAYNEGKPITEVDLEIEVKFIGYYEGTTMENWDRVIKTRPDNTVIIHQSKMYSRDEVEKLLIAFGNYPVNRNCQEWINDWIKNNL